MPSADVTTESLAAEVSELIFERWLDSADRGYVYDCAGMEALVILGDALRQCAASPADGALLMRATIQALKEMAPFAGEGDLRRRVAEIARSSARYAQRSGAP